MAQTKLLLTTVYSIITLAFLGSMATMAAEDFDPKTEKPIIDLIRESPDAIPLEPRDPSRKDKIGDVYASIQK